MQLAIPQAPRRVSLIRVPGALARLGRVLLGGLALMAALGAGAALLGRFVVEEQGFLARAEPLDGQLVTMTLPPLDERDGAEARLEVLYNVGPVSYSASGVRARVEDVEGLGRGARIPLLVDPQVPDKPREERHVRARARALGLVPWGVLLGALGALGLFAWELKRTLRAELEPLRKGMLVWLTPDAALPESRREAIFPATYWKQDQKHAVRARLRGGRAPVRNGDKVLAAVLSSLPGEARVIDEELARTLEWVR
ncbi:hypothetical protein D187_008230 [Cystobacter fuscus DSM 2262]|uniref:DUF3592 domain-containing protein n=1 Tax=Cystobacter fuscus (strain ATCC 25194 / DSM 2262 / NBRC 100088 / M29) TaxID=1242864 RepID=S9NUW6_CYSF2|nr:hypothetical protein [Cystobacter fuscus]EPX55975.1 hypothetical protein D187_008230 [Cystobacter fuscus DSM 2262]